MENQKKLLQFVEWLGQNVPELKGQGPEQIVSAINELSKSDEGKQMLQGLIQEFESSMTSMFKKGGKLDYLLCLKSGGNIQDCGCGKKINKKQPGGSIASRIWNRIAGKDKYTDGYGTKRQHAPVKESAHRTIVNAADSPMVQVMPIIGDVADGYVAADYASRGDYKPAIAAIGAGLVLPNTLEAVSKTVPKKTRKKAVNKAFDEIEDLWIPESVYDDTGNIVRHTDGAMSSEPWWGWDPIEYQDGGRFNKNKKIKKAQDGTVGLRQRGTADAQVGVYAPKYIGDEKSWANNRGAAVKNVFRGRDLYQNVVTADENGVPRRSIRVIYDYDIPTKSDTTYIDARGLESSRNPSFMQKAFGKVHSNEFMDNVDYYLEGMEPRYLSGKEVKAFKKTK